MTHRNIGISTIKPNPDNCKHSLQFPIGSSLGAEHSLGNGPREEPNRGDQAAGPNPIRFPTPDITTNRRGRPRGRQPYCKKGSSTSSSRDTATSRGPVTRARRGLRNRTSTRDLLKTLEQAMTLPDIPKSQSSNPQHVEQATSSQAQRYRLRANRAPVIGSRNFNCVSLVASETPVHRLARSGHHRL